MDKIRPEIDTDDVLFEHEPIHTTPSVQVEPESTFDFADILFKENNENKHRKQKKKKKLERNT